MPAAKRKSANSNQTEFFTPENMTEFPQSDWRPPDIATLPDRLYGVVGLDLETRDLGLQANQGPGWAWGGGYPVGYSVTADNGAWYLPLRHEGGDNVEVEPALKWLRHVLGRTDQTTVFANAMYDIGFSATDGVTIPGTVIDVQWVEALLDEYQLSYSLDSIARRRLGYGKEEDLLDGATRAYGGKGKGDLWRLPARFVGPYAVVDSQLPRVIWAQQQKEVEAQDLRGIVQLEHDLLPMYLDMRRRGIRIDVAYAERLQTELEGKNEALAHRLHRDYGYVGGAWSKAKIVQVLKSEGVPTGGATCDAAFLQSCNHSFAAAILEWRQQDKLLGTFVKSQILGNLHGHRVHGEIRPLASDEGGTISGRLSMSNPNLQNIPVRSDIGKLLRGLFLPEQGEYWSSPDFSQQEVRLMVHFAVLAKCQGAKEAKRSYETDPDLNYHKFTAKLTGLDYKAAKNLNFAILYGRGITATSRELGLSEEATRDKFHQHAQKMPFARALSRLCMRRVRKRGYLRTLGGRHCRFPYWEPMDWEKREKGFFLREQAEKKWGLEEPLSRARIHKSLNSLIQPSAADQMKMAMRAIWQAGLGHHVLVQVHDELGVSVPDQQTADRIAALMRDAVPLEVPVAVDAALGANWREAKS